MSSLAPAAWPAEDAALARLLVVNPARGRLPRRTRLATCESLLRPGDLLVAERRGHAAGLARRPVCGGPLEVRLAGPPSDDGLWPAVLFGPGTGAPGPRTGRRRRGSRWGTHPIRGARAGVRARGRGRRGVDPVAAARRAPLRSDGAPCGPRSSESAGRYSTRTCADRCRSGTRRPRTRAGRGPSEMPSAGRADFVAAARALRTKGVAIADGHPRRRPLVDGRPGARRGAAAAGASLVPRPAVAAVDGGQGRGRPGRRGRHHRGARARRCLREGRRRAGAKRTNLRIGPGFRPRVVAGSSPASTSRERATSSCCRPSRRGRCSSPRSRTRARAGYLGHEFGDSSLILAE